MAAAINKDKEVEEDMILKELQYIKYRISTSSSILTDRTRPLLLRGDPEEMILIDTQKRPSSSPSSMSPERLRGEPGDPESLASQDIPEYLRNRMQMQKGT